MDACMYAYLAGIVDGEGTITIHCHIQHNRRTAQLRPRLIVSNTNKEMLLELQRRHGGTVILNSAGRRPHHKDAYLWRVAGASDLLHLVRKIRPFLIIKRYPASLLLEFLDSRVAAKAASAAVGGRVPSYSPAEVAAYKAIRDFNDRGSTKRLSANALLVTQAEPGLNKAPWSRGYDTGF